MQQESSPLTTGRIVADRYRLEKRLGDGNFGEVWRATDVRLERGKIGLSNGIAIKFLKDEYVNDPEVRADFGGEVRILYQLTHHNLLRLFDFDLLPDMAYLVTEYAEGGSLAHLLSQKRFFSPAEAGHYLQQAAAGLDYAHSQKFVHRDLKPHNLLVASQDRLVVADFGLSQISNISATRSMMQLAPCGTPAYMAPEQWEWLAGSKSDIYALGVMLFQMLTGRLPFRAANGSPKEWKELHQHAPIPSLRKMKSDLPPELDEIIQWSLEKDPKSRPATAGEMMDNYMQILESLDSSRKSTKITPLRGLKRPSAKPHHEENTIPLEVSSLPTIPPDSSAIADVRPIKGWPSVNGLPETPTPAALPNGNDDIAIATRTQVPAGRTVDPTAITPQSKANQPSLIRKLGTNRNQRTMRSPNRFIPLGTLIKTFAGHSGIVSSVAFSPDSLLLASASLDKTVRLWNVESGELSKMLSGHTGPVQAVAFTMDGKILASAASDKTIRLWDVESGELLRTLEGHTGPVFAVAFSPDGTLLASGATDKCVKLWSTGSWEPIATLEGHTQNVTALAFAPEGDGLVSASRDGTLRVWELPSGAEMAVLEGHDEGVQGVAFSPDGKRLASGSMDKSVKLWNLESGLDYKTYRPIGGDWVHGVAFSPGGYTLASASNTIRLRDMNTGTELTIIQGHEDLVNSVAFSPDGHYLASGADDKLVKLWWVERLDV